MRSAGFGSLPRLVLAFFSRKRAPPPTASTDTASITSSLLRSMKPNRDLCAFSKRRLHLAAAAPASIDQRGVGARRSEYGARMIVLILPAGTPWPATSRLHVLAELAADALEHRQRLAAERLLDRLLPRRADIGEAHAIGREQRRERMDQHRLHAERIGDQAGMLPAGAAEAVERIARHVIAALHGNLLDRVRHVLDRDLDEAVGDLFRGLAAPVVRTIFCARLLEVVPHRLRRRAAGPGPGRKSSGRNRG